MLLLHALPESASGSASSEGRNLVSAMKFSLESGVDLKLPVFTKTVQIISGLERGGDDGPNPKTLFEALQIDPIATVAVLRRVNSAYFGLSRHVNDLHQAIILLGYRQVREIVVATSLISLADVFSCKEQITIYEMIVRHSIATAAFGRDLTRIVDPSLGSKLFTIGMLHGIGRMLLLSNRAEDYEALWFTTENTSLPSHVAERTIFGTDHAELGAFALKAWHLPEVFIDVIGGYKRIGLLSEKSLRLMALCLSVASAASEKYCIDRIGVRSIDHFMAPVSALSKISGISSSQIKEVIESSAEEIRAYVDAIMAQ